MNRTKQLLTGMSLFAFAVDLALADYTLNMTQGVTRISREAYDLHMLAIWICTAIGVVVFGTMLYSIINHRKSKGSVAANFHESAKVEIIWTLIPFIILIGLIIPATKAMIDIDDTSNPDMSIKVTGYQWRWRYEYLDEGIDFISSLDAKSNEARQLGSGINPNDIPNYLLNVDNPLVVPINTKIRFLFTSADVLHSWWVPALGWKKDTVPGFINESWTLIEKTGTYRGQCAELCGKDHGFMPIVVIAKTERDYKAWVKTQKAAEVDKVKLTEQTWTQDNLISKGKKVYNSSCASCHQMNGEGVPGTFPAIANSPVATGDIKEHINVVLNGKGGMMPPFSATLDAVDLAAVITYQRNAFGNDMDDSIQPAEIKKLLTGVGDAEDEDEE